jgi:hypothetical protein
MIFTSPDLPGHAAPVDAEAAIPKAVDLEPILAKDDDAWHSGGAHDH